MKQLTLNGDIIFGAQAKAELGRRKVNDPSTAKVKAIIAHSLYIQYDPLRIVAPSHYLTLFARDACFSYDDVTRGVSLENSIIEVWIRVASFMCLEDFRTLGPEFRRRRVGPLRYGEQRRVGSEIHSLASQLMRLISLADGPLTASEVENIAGLKRGIASGSWKTGVVRTVLNYLWYRGYLAIVGRDLDQQPRFDTSQRTVGDHFSGPFVEDEYKILLDQLVVRTVNALMAATPAQVAWYLGLPASQVRSEVERLVETNILVPVAVAEVKSPYYATRESCMLLREYEKETHAAADTRIISPFDSLVVDRARLKQLTRLHFRAELFTPTEQRSGATPYPLLMIRADQISGIIWLKADRRGGVLRLLDSQKLRGRPTISNSEWAAIRRVAAFVGLAIE
jgi:uncharacterized protein